MRPFLDDRIPQPDPSGSLSFLLVPVQHGSDESHYLVFRQKSGEQGADQRISAPLAADANGVAAFRFAPGAGGTDLDTVAAPDAGFIAKDRLVVLPHNDRLGDAVLGAQATADTGVLV